MNKHLLLFLSLVLCVSAASLQPVHYDPFREAKIMLKNPKKALPYKGRNLVLGGVFNNKAYINGKFYTIHDKIEGYTIKEIGKDFVILQKANRVKRLQITTKKSLNILKELDPQI